MPNRLKKSAASTGKALVTTDSTGATSRLLVAEAKDVTYGPFSGSASRELTFKLEVSHAESVPAAFYEYVKLRAEQNVRCVYQRSYFPIVELVGVDSWTSFSQDEKHMAEICIAHLCQTGTLPLGSSGFGLSYPEFYHLKNTAVLESK